MAIMQATLIHRFRSDTLDGIIEITIWRVPEPVPPAGHDFKYRLVYVKNGQRVVGFDNERGKGDHCHLDGREFPYTFVSLDRLVDDFLAAVEERRN
jgi:hypothetical protein